jgi:hypothetical protein
MAVLQFRRFFLNFILGVGWDWVHLVRRPLSDLLYQPRMIDDDCGAVGGMRIGRGNRSTQRIPAQLPLCPIQILYDQIWARTRPAAVAQAFSHRVVTAAARVRDHVNLYGICGGQSDTGAGFLRVLRISLPILIPPTPLYSYSSSGAGTICQLVADVPSGLKSHLTSRN